MRRGFAGWRVCQTRAIEPHGHARHAQAHAHLLKRFGHDGPPANNQSPKKCDIFYWDGGQGKLGPEKVETSGLSNSSWADFSRLLVSQRTSLHSHDGGAHGTARAVCGWRGCAFSTRERRIAMYTTPTPHPLLNAAVLSSQLFVVADV